MGPPARIRIVWWTGPPAGEPEDFSHAFPASEAFDQTRTTFEAIGSCHYPVLVVQVTSTG